MHLPENARKVKKIQGLGEAAVPRMAQITLSVDLGVMATCRLRSSANPFLHRPFLLLPD